MPSTMMYDNPTVLEPEACTTPSAMVLRNCLLHRTTVLRAPVDKRNKPAQDRYKSNYDSRKCPVNSFNHGQFRYLDMLTLPACAENYMVEYIYTKLLPCTNGLIQTIAYTTK